MENNYKEQLKNFLDNDGKLRQFPKKHKLRMVIYAYLASKFEPGKIYTEKEVNEILNTYHTFGDWALLRREMYDRMFLDRKNDGSEYWLRENQPDINK